VINWLIFALHGGRALGEFGMFRQTHTAIFFLYSANVYPCTTESVDALQTFYVIVFCIIRSWFELLVRMVLFVDGVTPPLAGTLLCMRRYGVTQSDVLSGRRIDEFTCMGQGHSMEEITAEQERSVDFLQECIMLRDNVFSLPSYYTRTDIELIIQHLCMQIRLIS